MDEEDVFEFVCAWSLTTNLLLNSVSQLPCFQMAMTAQQQQQSNLQLVIRNRQRRKLKRRPLFWIVPRPPNSWLEHPIVDESIPEYEFKRLLHVTKETFWELARVCKNNITRENTNFRASLSPEKVLAIALYRLAHGVSFRVCAGVFNVGKTTAREAFEDFVSALITVKGNFIKFPSTLQEKKNSIDSFAGRSSLPNVIAAIDGTHIRIKAPKENQEDYFSRYHQYDVVCQGVVDGHTRFLDIVAGFPGSMHDSRVLRNTKISRFLNEGFSVPQVKVNGKSVSPYLVGNSAYPLMTTILKPFSDSTTDSAEKKFNIELSRAHVAVECAFGVLKSRFQILMKKIDDTLERSNQIIVACCVLHNICIGNGDEWEIPEVEIDTKVAISGENDRFNGKELRETIKEYIFNIH